MSESYQLLFATTNAGKARELRAYLSDLPVEVRTLADLTNAPEVEEDRPSLQGNARKKAETLYRHTGIPTVADDTGLEVDALGGAPGVRSARFAGNDVTEADNRAKLLREMEQKTNRNARFRTVLAFTVNGETRFFEGVCNGTITKAERGDGGFGYDSLFKPEGETRTFAELTKEEKNSISHRGHALQKFVAALRS